MNANLQHRRTQSYSSPSSHWLLLVIVVLHGALAWILSTTWRLQEITKESQAVSVVVIAEPPILPAKRPAPERPSAPPPASIPPAKPSEPDALETVDPLPSSEPLKNAAFPPIPDEPVTGRVSALDYCVIAPPPAYPANAHRLGIEGKVLVRFRVDSQGRLAAIVGAGFGGIPEAYREEFIQAIRATINGYQCSSKLEEATLQQAFEFRLNAPASGLE